MNKISDKKLVRLLENRMTTCRPGEVEFVKSELRLCRQRLIEKQARKDNKNFNEKFSISLKGN